MATRPWHLLSLCDGYGGTELALRSVARVRTVARVERDAYAAAVLVARMVEARLDQAPVWDDLCTFDGAAWRGRVDIVAAGFPCQPFSAAGKRSGTDDDRWLWPDTCRIIGEVRPRYVFLENVPGVVRHGLPHVLADLAALGFDAEWGLLSASDVGAPHRRQRFWLVADSAQFGRVKRIDGAQPGGLPADTETIGGDVGHASGPGRSEVTGSPHGDEAPHGAQHSHVSDRPSEDVGHPSSVGRGAGQRPDTDQRQSRLTDTQIAEHRFPPRPDDHDGWQQWDGPQPSVRRSTDGTTAWLADALHLGGNGLVPQCAAEAWSQLADRLKD